MGKIKATITRPDIYDGEIVPSRQKTYQLLKETHKRVRLSIVGLPFSDPRRQSARVELADLRRQMAQVRETNLDPLFHTRDFQTWT